MLQEREILTVAFGNYSSLVAAQWANGTSHYDAHHSTLYTECRTADVLGGGDDSNARFTRVPRLLLLDAPYASAFDEVTAWADKVQEQEAALEGMRNEEDACNTDSNRDTRFNTKENASPSSVLWGSRSAPGGGGGRPVDAEVQRFARVAQAVQRRVWKHHGLDDDEEKRSEDGEDEEDKDKEDDYAQLRRELGIAATWASPAATSTHDDPDIQPRSLQTHGDGRREEEEEESNTRHNIPCHKQTQKQRLGKLKQKLFDTHNATVPWWQYITTGISGRSVTSLKPLQHLDATGDVPALHSFGYGLANLKPHKREELSVFTDALHHQLESADQLQGVQCFTDGDGIFGGAATNLLEQFWEDAGAKIPVVNFCTFAKLPSFLTDPSNRERTAFRERRLDEVALNQLLATVHLSRHPSAVYVPVPLAQWGTFFTGTAAAKTPTEAPAWVQDERATAQYLAAVADTALYGTRDGNEAQTSATAGLTAKGPMYYMDDWCRVVRPAPSLRVAAAMGALPLPVSQSTELWQFLEASPLLPDAPPAEREDGRTPHASGRGNEASKDRDATFKTGFVPLTHAIATYSPLRPAGQVLGHAVSLRGAGALPSRVYPTKEAMLRYAIPLRTATYLPLLAQTNYPLSGTFPMELMFAEPTAVERQLPRGFASLRDTLQSVDVGAHVLSTYASAPFLHDIARDAQKALRYKTERYCAAYAMERDDWREVLDEGLALYDDYHHAAPSEDDGEDDGYY